MQQKNSEPVMIPSFISDCVLGFRFEWKKLEEVHIKSLILAILIIFIFPGCSVAKQINSGASFLYTIGCSWYSYDYA
jgi:hypothetical protein